MKKKMNNKGYMDAGLVGIIIGIVLVLGIIYTLLCLEIIPAGYVGVVYKPSTGIAEETLTQGWKWISPLDKVTEYSIGIEQSYLTATDDGDSSGDDSFSAPSSDGKGLQMELTFTYRYDEARVADTFTRFKGRSGKELLKTFIKPNVISWTKEVTATYPVTDILGEKRAELNNVLGDYLAEKFEPYGIIIESASLINIEVDDETRASITKKVTAQQALELAKIEEETAKINARKEKEIAIIDAEKQKESAEIETETKKIIAENEAQIAIIEAEANANTVKIQAEAEAEANRKISESLTPELLDKMKYEAWDGQLPQVQGSTTPIISIN